MKDTLMTRVPDDVPLTLARKDPLFTRPPPIFNTCVVLPDEKLPLARSTPPDAIVTVPWVVRVLPSDPSYCRVPRTVTDLQPAAPSTVTVVPAATMASSAGPGTEPPLHVAGLFQLPEIMLVKPVSLDGTPNTKLADTGRWSDA
jgi:hypothetical protein